MSLGDHDQRGNVAAQVAYTNVSNKWQMPAPFFVKHITSKFNQHTLDLIFTDSIGLEVGKFQIEIHIIVNFLFKLDWTSQRLFNLLCYNVQGVIGAPISMFELDINMVILFAMVMCFRVVF